MAFRAKEILEVLDRAAALFDFPMLDNGYVHPAATRLSLFRSPEDWALVIERFGYSPRAYLPSIDVMTFASRLHDRPPPSKGSTLEQHRQWQSVRPNNELASFCPLADGDWIDNDHSEWSSRPETSHDTVGRWSPTRTGSIGRTAAPSE